VAARCFLRGFSSLNGKKQKRPHPIHPGEILREDFLRPVQLSINQLAMDLHVPVMRIAEIVHERRGITPGRALRRVTSTAALASGSNLPADYDLEVAVDKLTHDLQ
jgi:antitoxin HigA-1